MLLDHPGLVCGLKRPEQLLCRLIALVVQVQVQASIMVQDEGAYGIRPLDLQGVNQATSDKWHLSGPELRHRSRAGDGQCAGTDAVDVNRTLSQAVWGTGMGAHTSIS